MNYREQYQIWCNEPSMPADMKQRLAAMEADEQGIKGCFGAELQFGTAGGWIKDWRCWPRSFPVVKFKLWRKREVS